MRPNLAEIEFYWFGENIVYFCKALDLFWSLHSPVILCRQITHLCLETINEVGDGVGFIQLVQCVGKLFFSRLFFYWRYFRGIAPAL